MKKIAIASVILACMTVALSISANAQTCDSTTISRLVVIDPNNKAITWHGAINATFAIVDTGILDIREIKVLGTFDSNDGKSTVGQINITWDDLFALKSMEVKDNNGQIIASVTSKDLVEMKRDWRAGSFVCEDCLNKSLLYRDRFGQFEGREIGPFPHETLGFAGYLNAYGELMGR